MFSTRLFIQKFKGQVMAVKKKATIKGNSAQDVLSGKELTSAAKKVLTEKAGLKGEYVVEESSEDKVVIKPSGKSSKKIEVVKNGGDLIVKTVTRKKPRRSELSRTTSQEKEFLRLVSDAIGESVPLKEIRRVKLMALMEFRKRQRQSYMPTAQKAIGEILNEKFGKTASPSRKRRKSSSASRDAKVADMVVERLRAITQKKLISPEDC